MSRDIVCAILAAGRASRIGVSKAALRYRGRTFLEHALRAADGRPTVVVAAAREPWMETLLVRYGARSIVNGEPHRGMTHSLRLADRALGRREAALAVLLVDTPLVDAGIMACVATVSQSADVAFPVHPCGKPGHPVIFGPRARRAFDGLPDGDTLRVLRDDPRFTHATVCVDGEAPFTDVDTIDDFTRLTATITNSAPVGDLSGT